jgi:cobalt/nickel transport system permease protein
VNNDPRMDERSGYRPCQCSTIYHGKKSFVGKTIDGILTFLEEAFISESFSRRKGFLQSLDPRAKLISILVLVFTTTLIGDLRLLVFVYMLTLLFSYLSKIDVLFFIKRVWLFIPIFAGIIAIPMVFNIFFPGDRLSTIIQ